MYYEEYQKVCNTAWKTLIDFGVRKLPINIGSLINQAGITLLANSEVTKLKNEEVGVSFLVKGKWYIIFDDQQSLQMSRFTVAHELGHILLNHFANDLDISKLDIEKEADIFASRILAPACVLWGLNLQTAEEIAEFCQISRQAAKIRAARMKILYERNKFLTNPLEKQVFEQFRDFIAKYKK